MPSGYRAPSFSSVHSFDPSTSPAENSKRTACYPLCDLERLAKTSGLTYGGPSVDPLLRPEPDDRWSKYSRNLVLVVSYSYRIRTVVQSYSRNRHEYKGGYGGGYVSRTNKYMAAPQHAYEYSYETLGVQRRETDAEGEGGRGMRGMQFIHSQPSSQCAYKDLGEEKAEGTGEGCSSFTASP